MSRTAFLSAGLTTVMLAGRVSEPVRAPHAALPSAYEAPAGATAASADIDRWWTLYDDPQLTALVQTALAQAPDAEAALARLREARGVRAGVLAGYGPQGDINGQVTNTTAKALSGSAVSIPGLAPGAGYSGSGESLISTGTLNVSWEIDLFGRRRTARGMADADLAAARFDYEATRASLAASVAYALFAARGLAIQLDDAEQSARIAADLAAGAQAKSDTGLSASADADQAQAEAALASASAADLRGQLQAARRQLLILVGRGADPLADLPVPASAGAPPAVPATVPAELLVRRPDVREAEAKLQSAAAKLRLDRRALLPTVNLTPGLNVTRLAETGFSSATAAWSIGSTAVLPLLSRPKLAAEIHAQGGRAEGAVIAYEKAVQTAFGEAENALAQLAEDQLRVRLLTTGEAKARRAFDAARARYAAGMDDLVTTLGAERTWRASRTALTAAQVQALRRSVTAFKALGGGWSAPAAQTTSIGDGTPPG